MSHNHHVLTPPEWYVMECLWEKSPRTGREVVEHLEKAVGWSRSTSLTMLRRMTEKGMICCDESGTIRHYTPLVNQDEATTQQTSDFLSRVYHGSIGMMLSAFTKKQSLTQAEIDELYSILDKAKEDLNNQ